METKGDYKKSEKYLSPECLEQGLRSLIMGLRKIAEDKLIENGVSEDLARSHHTDILCDLFNSSKSDLSHMSVKMMSIACSTRKHHKLIDGVIGKHNTDFYNALAVVIDSDYLLKNIFDDKNPVNAVFAAFQLQESIGQLDRNILHDSLFSTESAKISRDYWNNDPRATLYAKAVAKVDLEISQNLESHPDWMSADYKNLAYNEIDGLDTVNDEMLTEKILEVMDKHGLLPEKKSKSKAQHVQRIKKKA